MSATITNIKVLSFACYLRASCSHKVAKIEKKHRRRGWVLTYYLAGIKKNGVLTMYMGSDIKNSEVGVYPGVGAYPG